ncbi:G-protein coupled receptor 4-like [Mustelus asterias]
MNQSSTNCSQCQIDFKRNGVELAAMYSVTFTMSFTMNCLTLWPIILQVRQRNVLGIYLLSLSISDFLYVLTIPLWVLYYYNGHHWMFSQTTCFFAGFVFYSNIYISIFLLCCISTDRYLAVVYPFESQGFRRPATAVRVSLLIFLTTFAFHLAIFLGSASQDGGHEADNKTCFEHIPLIQSVAVSNYLRFAVGFLAPLLVLIISYQRIFKGVRKSVTLSREQKSKVKLISISVILIFVICFAPYHIILLLRTINFTLVNCSCDFEERVHLAFNVALALTSLNSAVDPILYVLVSNSVKKDLRKSLTSWGWAVSAQGRVNSSPTSLPKTTAAISRA